MNEDPAAQAPVILGIDDLRPLPRATRIARTSREGVQLLEEFLALDEVLTRIGDGADARPAYQMAYPAIR